MTVIRSPAIAAIAAYTVAFLTAQYYGCNAFSVSSSMNYRTQLQINLSIRKPSSPSVQSASRLQMSSSLTTEEEADASEAAVELKMTPQGIYDLQSKEDHM